MNSDILRLSCHHLKNVYTSLLLTSPLILQLHIQSLRCSFLPYPYLYLLRQFSSFHHSITYGTTTSLPLSVSLSHTFSMSFSRFVSLFLSVSYLGPNEVEVRLQCLYSYFPSFSFSDPN